MALFLRQDEQRSEVQTRVATELQARLKQKAAFTDENEETTLTSGQHKTRLAGMIIIGLIVVIVIAVIVLAIRLS
jgi:F0F1-type ATP synthase assembly protein I